MTCRLGFQPLEQRALLSVDMQFHHIIFDPSTGAASVQSGVSGAVATKVAPLGSSLPPGSALLLRCRFKLHMGSTRLAGTGPARRLPFWTLTTIPTSSTTCSSLTSNLIYLPRPASSNLMKKVERICHRFPRIQRAVGKRKRLLTWNGPMPSPLGPASSSSRPTVLRIRICYRLQSTPPGACPGSRWFP